MKNVFLVLLVSAVCWSGVEAQKIKVSYDKQVEFSQFKTFAFAKPGPTTHPMLAANIVGAIEDELKSRGLYEVGRDESPALMVQVYGALDQDSSLTSNDPLYATTGGIPPFDPSFSGPLNTGMYGNATITVHKGQLVVDLIDMVHKKLVWRGMAQQNLAANNPNKLLSQVNNAIAKMFKQYPVKAKA